MHWLRVHNPLSSAYGSIHVVQSLFCSSNIQEAAGDANQPERQKKESTFLYFLYLTRFFSNELIKLKKRLGRRIITVEQSNKKLLTGLTHSDKNCGKAFFITANRRNCIIPTFKGIDTWSRIPVVVL